MSYEYNWVLSQDLSKNMLEGVIQNIVYISKVWRPPFKMFGTFQTSSSLMQLIDLSILFSTLSPSSKRARRETILSLCPCIKC